MSMIDHQFETKIVRLMNGVAAGTGDNQDGSLLDTFGYDAVEFVGLVGALTSTNVTTFKIRGGDLANGSDLADLTGASVAFTDADDNKCARINLMDLQHRYLKPRFTRATANAVLDGVIAILYKGKNRPASEDSTCVGAVNLAGARNA